jgi:hypothetical protein
MFKTITDTLNDPKVAGASGAVAGVAVAGLFSFGRRKLRERAIAKAHKDAEDAIKESMAAAAK